MNEKTELLPCPFCGEPARVFTGNTTGIACSNDQCVIYTDTPLPFNDHGHFESAVAAWNRRAASPSSKSTKEADKLHAAIMNLPANRANSYRTTAERFAYAAGHRDARHAAAELALASSSIKEDGERAEPNIPKIETDAIFHSTMTCLPAIKQAYRYFHAQGKTEEDFDRCALEAMTKAVRNAVQLTAREVADPVWPYVLEPAPSSPPSPLGDTPEQQEQKR